MIFPSKTTGDPDIPAIVLTSCSGFSPPERSFLQLATNSNGGRATSACWNAALTLFARDPYFSSMLFIEYSPE